MKRTRARQWTLSLSVLLLVSFMLLPGSALATSVSGDSYSVTFNNPPFGVTSVKIAAPGGKVTKAKGLTVFAKEQFADGDYQYELIGKLAKQETLQPQSTESNGRDKNVRLKDPVGVIESGDFRIVNGGVVDTRNLTEE